LLLPYAPLLAIGLSALYYLDQGLSIGFVEGTYALLAMLSGVFFLVILIFMILPGTAGNNRFGSNASPTARPEAPKTITSPAPRDSAVPNADNPVVLPSEPTTFERPDSSDLALNYKASQAEAFIDAAGPIKPEVVEKGADHCGDAVTNSMQKQSFPLAMMAIEYRPEAEAAWSKMQELPENFQKRFLEDLDANPTVDPAVLCRELEVEHIKTMRPYDDEAANDALQDVRTIGDAAEQEFKKVYSLFSTTIPLEELVRRVESKFGPTERTRLEREAKDRAAREAKDRAEQEAADQAHRDAAKRAEEDARSDKKVFAAILALFLFILFGASIIG
jgi:hypothetical protein